MAAGDAHAATPSRRLFAVEGDEDTTATPILERGGGATGRSTRSASRWTPSINASDLAERGSGTRLAIIEEEKKAVETQRQALRSLRADLARVDRSEKSAREVLNNLWDAQAHTEYYAALEEHSDLLARQDDLQRDIAEARASLHDTEEAIDRWVDDVTAAVRVRPGPKDSFSTAKEFKIMQLKVENLEAQQLNEEAHLDRTERNIKAFEGLLRWMPATDEEYPATRAEYEGLHSERREIQRALDALVANLADARKALERKALERKALERKAQERKALVDCSVLPTSRDPDRVANVQARAIVGHVVCPTDTTPGGASEEHGVDADDYAPDRDADQDESTPGNDEDVSTAQGIDRTKAVDINDTAPTMAAAQGAAVDGLTPSTAEPAGTVDSPGYTATADAEVGNTIAETRSTWAVDSEDDNLAEQVTVDSEATDSRAPPTDPPPSGGRGSHESYASIVKSPVDLKHEKLEQTTAVSPPRSIPPPLCASSRETADRNKQPGQGKDAPADAPPRPPSRQSSGGSKPRSIMILQRAGGPPSPVPGMPCAPRDKPPAAESPRKGDRKNRGRIAKAKLGKNVPVGDAQVDILRRKLTQLQERSRRDSDLARLAIERLNWKNGVLRKKNACLQMELTRSTEMALEKAGDDDTPDDNKPPALREDVPDQRGGNVVPAAVLHSGDDEDESKEASSFVREPVPNQCDGDVLPAAVSPADYDEGNVEVALNIHRSTNNLQSIFAAPLTAFPSMPASTDNIRPIETTNQQTSQDLEGLPPEPKRKRRRIRKRKRRRSGRNKKSRLKHSPVTPPNQHARARRRSPMTYKSLGKEIISEDTGHCPISGFHTIWDRTSWPRRRLATGIG